MSLDPGVRTAELITELLERGYDTATAQTVRAILRGNTSGIIDRRLTELKAEAARLVEAGERLTPNNPVMRALFADMEDVLQQNRRLIAQAGVRLQADSVEAAALINRQLALPGFSDVELARLGARWNTADPEVVNELVGFVTNPAWEAQLGSYGDDVLNVVRNQAITGTAQGWGPARITRAITRKIRGLPAAGDIGRVAGVSEHQAQNMMRTLQMQSFRGAQTINRVVNADILEEQIRIAALDERTCLACVSLHGERFPINERIDDHHQGRCTSIPVVRGRPRTVTSGEEWWNGLSEQRQLAQAGPANFAALQSGAVDLGDFVQPYDDPVFGSMLRESSLSGVLGEGAQEFYS